MQTHDIEQAESQTEDRQLRQILGQSFDSWNKRKRIDLTFKKFLEALKIEILSKKSLRTNSPFLSKMFSSFNSTISNQIEAQNRKDTRDFLTKYNQNTRSIMLEKRAQLEDQQQSRAALVHNFAILSSDVSFLLLCELITTKKNNLNLFTRISFGTIALFLFYITYTNNLNSHLLYLLSVIIASIGIWILGYLDFHKTKSKISNMLDSRIAPDLSHDRELRTEIQIILIKGIRL